MSLGSPSHGRLRAAAVLPLSGQGFRFNPEKDPLRRHGTVEVVRALSSAAGAVQDRLPGGILTISDLSLPEGGPIEGHASHQNGRDVDVLFYLLDDQGEPVGSKAIPIEPGGTGTDYRDLADGSDDVAVRLDVARTWAFLAALLSQPGVTINRIFLVEHLRTMLIEHARAVGAEPGIVELFGNVTCQPRFPHDDHMHIRFFCTPEDIAAGCEDTPPVYPWQQRLLAFHGCKVRPPTRSPARARVTTMDAAEADARREHGFLHPEVVAFLKRRKAWARKPHPGRAYCP